MRAASLGAIGLPLGASPRISPLAARLGLDEEDAAAARREAELAESRGDHARALDIHRIALFIEPSDASSWRGLARVARQLGAEQAAGRLEDAARVVAAVAERRARERSASWTA
jgi:hypothetical protein